MYLFLLVGLLILYAAIAWRDLRLAVFLLLACLPTYLLRLEVLVVPVTFLELMLGVIIIFWLRAWWQKKINHDFNWLKPWLLPLALLIIAGTIGVFVAPNTLAALGIFKAYLLEPIVFFVILFTTLKWHDDAEPALIFLGLGALFVASFAIVQKFTGWALPIPWDIEGRTTSLFPYPNAVGLYLGPIIVIGFITFWHSLQEKFYLKAWFWLITVGVSAVAVFFSQTEAAWVAIPSALLLSALFLRRTRLLAVVLIVLAMIVSLSVPTFKNKIFLGDYSGGVRIKQWEETFNLLKDQWLFGAGLSGYPTALGHYHNHQEIEIFQYPHNIFLNIWSELGLLGLLAFLMFIRQIFKNFRLAQKKDSSLFWLSFATSTALLEMFIHGLVDVPFFKNDLALLTAATLALLAWSATGPYAHKIIEQTKEE
ncbi:MAG: O-antigen polymerase [Candidatus Uhrbacteria bacterium GW2011_GWE2_45_35]|uniref:O-antigen polymerase n=2 Tax=Candidatus Uhriibacteriota TaxID=1752732 RepID=A0A0G1JCI8_9BACT|nr:MAG: O-antigen polymerase [Candidatus Uhrbacteria bacterium GW2011_GWF2_44_350]KKU06476.1 MAG: O-antigen polymerase [Candidatus Uhrbacteria bacterium GW2011_GWE2_45_35]HBR80370.1 hypothetical protein [Candidatus Uhrbacteria bacterium]HCU32122.1 hypothetical protein [Candidatus Uhrbacteria bacterium]